MLPEDVLAKITKNHTKHIIDRFFGTEIIGMDQVFKLFDHYGVISEYENLFTKPGFLVEKLTKIFWWCGITISMTCSAFVSSLIRSNLPHV